MGGSNNSPKNNTNGSGNDGPGKPGEGRVPKYPFHEFMVDFLGGLVPGTLFLVGASSALLPPTYLFFCIASETQTISLKNFITDFFTSVQQTPNFIWIALFAIFIALSYVVGHLFYRRGPKKPDRKSFMKLSKYIILRRQKKVLFRLFNRKTKEISSLKKAFKKLSLYCQILYIFIFPLKNKILNKYKTTLKTELACINEDECEFPYPRLRDYIGQRGLCHLCGFVTWKDKDYNEYRSKTYINLLKIRLRYFSPEKCSVIIRNEAHVRLASSSWYVSHALRVCSIIGTTFVILGVIIHFYTMNKSLSAEFHEAIAYTPFLIPPVIVFFAGEYIRTRIERFIHYQRLREIIYVYETAYNAFRNRSKLMNPPFVGYKDEFKLDNLCRKCDYYDKASKVYPVQ